MARKPTKPETSPTISTDAPSTPEDASSDGELTAYEIMLRREASLTPSQKKEQEEELKRERELISKGIWGIRRTLDPKRNRQES